MKVLEAETSAKDACSGTAKVQGILWRCGKADEVGDSVTRFRERLAREAKAECEKHCERRASGCRGVLVPVTRCGLETDREDALAMGKRQGCGPNCPGPAFTYCSLYDAGFRTEDPDRVRKQTPNCRCIPSR